MNDSSVRKWSLLTFCLLAAMVALPNEASATSTCGDDVCEAGEDCNSCPADCPSFPVAASCGNGLCEVGDGEDCVNCPSDCAGQQGGKPAGRYCCGNGGEYPVACGSPLCTSGGFNCTDTPVSGTTCCGDWTCMAPEDVCSCSIDCGAPPADEVGACTDGEDNDCNGDIDCADSDCAGDPACQGVDCSSFTNKESCDAEPSCHWSNKDKACLPP